MNRSADLTTSPPGFFASAGLMAGSLAVWAAHFTAVYGFVALACARGWTGSSVFGIGLTDAAVAVATVAALAATVLLAIVGWRRRGGLRPDSRFVADVTLLTALLASLGIVWTALPAFLVPMCA